MRAPLPLPLPGEEFLELVEVLPVMRPLRGALGGLVTKTKKGYRDIAPSIGDDRKDLVDAPPLTLIKTGY